MRRFFVPSALLLSLAMGGYVYQRRHHKPFIQVLHAQSFPVTLHLEFTPNPASDNVANYTVQLDSNAVVPVSAVPDVTCACIKSPASQVSDSNIHVYHAKAVNTFGLISPDAAFSFRITVPNQVVGGVVKPN
jgi:hypothetical protein